MTPNNIIVLKQQKYKSERVLQLTTGKILAFFDILDTLGFLWLLQVLFHNFQISSTAQQLSINLSGAFFWVLLPLSIMGVSKIAKSIIRIIEATGD